MKIELKSVTAYILHLPQATIGQLIMAGEHERSNKEFISIFKRGLWGSKPQFKFDNYFWQASPRFYRLLTGDALSLGTH